MDLVDVQMELKGIFNSGTDDYDRPTRDYPHPKLEKDYGLDLAYLQVNKWEGSVLHPHTRTCSYDEPRIIPLIKNLDLPKRLFLAALQLFGDSILAYHEMEERTGELRYYPSVILTFWAGFESFVRHTSELMLVTVPNVPEDIVRFLREEEASVDPSGNVTLKTQYRPVLHRYSTLLRYGFDYKIDKGCKFWQCLDNASKLRNYYTHPDVNVPRAISSEEVLGFMESVLLGIITPSADMKRTQLLGIYHLYGVLSELRKMMTPFNEQPFLKDWPLDGPKTIYCPFKNVDNNRFPNAREQSRTGHEL